jgi:hypothetical protein
MRIRFSGVQSGFVTGLAKKQPPLPLSGIEGEYFGKHSLDMIIKMCYLRIRRGQRQGETHTAKIRRFSSLFGTKAT